jgi:hypothetical protein
MMVVTIILMLLDAMFQMIILIALMVCILRNLMVHIHLVSDQKSASSSSLLFEVAIIDFG